MTLEEIVVGIRISMEGVESGINRAAKSFGKIDGAADMLKTNLATAIQQASGAMDIAGSKAEVFAQEALALREEIKRLNAEFENQNRTLTGEKITPTTEATKKHNDELVKLQKQLIALEEKQHKATVEYSKQADALEQLTKIEKEVSGGNVDLTNSLEKSATAHKNSSQNADTNAVSIRGTGQAAMVAAGLFAVLTKSVIDGTNAYVEYVNNARAVEGVANSSGVAVGVLKGKVAELTNDGLIPTSDATKSLGDLLNSGFNADQAAELLNNFKGAAVKGKDASASLKDAVKSTAQELANGNDEALKNIGVNKTLASIHSDYAASLGKSASLLSESEKRQAEYETIMAATAGTVNDVEYALTGYEKAQAANSKASEDMRAALGEAAAGGLAPFLNLLTPLIEGTATFVSENQALTAGIIGFAGAGLSAVAVISTVQKLTSGLNVVKDLFLKTTVKTTTAIGAESTSSVVDAGAKTTQAAATNTATVAQQGLNTAMAMNPIGMVILGIGALVAALAMGSNALSQKAEAQQKLNEKLEEHNVLLEKGITKSQIAQEQEEIEKIEEAIEVLEKQAEAQEVLAVAIRDNSIEYGEATAKLSVANRVVNELAKTNEYAKGSVAKLTEMLKEKNDAIKAAEVPTRQEIDQLKQSTVRQIEQAQSIRNLANTLKTAKIGTSEYASAWKEVNEKYPEAIQNGKANADILNELADETEYAAKMELMLAQAKAIETSEAIKGIIAKKEELAIKPLVSKSILDMTEAEREHIATLLQEIAALNARNDALKGLTDINVNDYIQNIKAANVPGGGGGRSGGGGGSGSKQKTAEETAKENADKERKILDYQLKMEEISVADFYNRLAQIRDKYFKQGTDEWRNYNAEIYKGYDEIVDVEIRNYERRIGREKLGTEKQIELYQELYDNYEMTQQKRMDLEDKLWELEQQLIAKKEAKFVETYNNRRKVSSDWLDYMKSIGQLTAQEEMAAYTRIIARNKDTLQKIFDEFGDKMEGWSEEVKSLYQSVIEDTRQLENQINSIRLSQAEKLVDTLKKAVKSEFEERRKAEEENLRNSITLADKIRDRRIENINAEYKAKEDAINKEISKLDELLKAYDRGNKDEEELTKINRLKVQLDYETDEDNRKALAKQIESLEKQRNDRLFKQNIEDKKAALKEELSVSKTAKDIELENIKAVADAEKELLNQRLDGKKLYYEKLLEETNINKRVMDMLTDARYNDGGEAIKNLIANHAPEYMDSGINLGMMVLEGFDASFVNEMPNRVAQALGTFRTGSTEVQTAVADAGNTGKEIGEAIGSNVATEIEKTVNTVTDFINGILANIEMRINNIAASTQSLSAGTNVKYDQRRTFSPTYYISEPVSVREIARIEKQKQIEMTIGGYM